MTITGGDVQIEELGNLKNLRDSSAKISTRNDREYTHFAAELQSQNYVHVIEELLPLLPDPASKLKFIKEAVNDHHIIPTPLKFFSFLARRAYRKALLAKVEKIRPGSMNDAEKLTRRGISGPSLIPLWRYKVRRAASFLVFVLMILGLGDPLFSSLEIRHFFGHKNMPTKSIAENKGRPEKQLEPQKQPANAEAPIQDTEMIADKRSKADIQKYLTGPIWLVEKKQDIEVYSNGLHIITSHSEANTPRNYYRLARNSDPPALQWHQTNQISGILYHASESDIFPFIPQMNKSIKRYSKALIRYIKQKKSYHYFIDRFGRVYRLLEEDHIAHHAGNSIWADDEWIYLNLNHAFIAICFEGRDFEQVADEKSGERRKAPMISPDIRPVEISSFNEAQLRSGKELTDWLRVKYNIPQNNCVPHALASVNPDKMLIGYHLDFSRGFPFDQFGLSDKYHEPLPSMVEFGFGYDGYFEEIFDGSLWPGIRHAEKLLARRAREGDLDLAAYVKNLQEKYIRCIQWRISRGKQKEELATHTEESKLPKPDSKKQPFG